jgi:thiol-disulfide isomerase/thioredoxin
MRASEPGASTAGVEGADEHPAREREWAGGWRSLALPVAIVLLVAGGIFFFQSSDGGSADQEQGLGVLNLPAGANPGGEQPEARPGRLAPDFALRGLDSAALRLSDLRGRPVLINFWATWCGPCRAEMPEIEAASRALQGSGLVVVAVNVQESADKVQEWVSRFGLSFPVVLDDTGGVTRAYRATSALPTSVFVDASGRVAIVHVGQMSREDLARGLAPILESAPR